MRIRQSIFSARALSDGHDSSTTVSAKRLLSVNVTWHGDPLLTANARLVIKTKHGTEFICQRSEGNAIFDVDIAMDGRAVFKVVHGGDSPVICSGILLLESETASENFHRGKLISATPTNIGAAQ